MRHVVLKYEGVIKVHDVVLMRGYTNKSTHNLERGSFVSTTIINFIHVSLQTLHNLNPYNTFMMLRSITRNTVRKNIATTYTPAASQIRTMAAKNRVEDAAQAAGEAKKTSPQVFTIFEVTYQIT